MGMDGNRQGSSSSLNSQGSSHRNNNNNNNRDQGQRGGGGHRQQRNHNNNNNDQDNDPHPDEQVIFAKENLAKEGTFKYQPTRLSDTTDTTVIIAKAKMILNKLSVTNFDKLSVEFMNVGIDR